MEKDFAGLLIELRKKAGLRQSDVAQACGVAPQTVSAWETDRSAPTEDICEKIASVLGSDPVPLIQAAAKKRQRLRTPPGRPLPDTGDVSEETLPPLARAIRRRRIRLRSSVDDVARACEADVTDVERWERGEGRPHLRQAVLLSENLGLKTHELLQHWVEAGGAAEEPPVADERQGVIGPVRTWTEAEDIELYNIGGEFNYDWRDEDFHGSYCKVKLPVTATEAFACILRDSKMEPDLRRGDVLLFARSVEARSGDLALIRGETFAYVKLVFFETDTDSDDYLLSLHGHYEVLKWYKKGDLVRVHKMVGLFRRY